MLRWEATRTLTLRGGGREVDFARPPQCESERVKGECARSWTMLWRGSNIDAPSGSLGQEPGTGMGRADGEPGCADMSYQDRLAGLAKRYSLVAIYVFGSRAEEIAARVRGAEVGEPSSSDLDVGVLPEACHRLTARDRAELTLALEDLFEVPRVDLVVLPEADAFLALDVVRGELLYYADADAEAEYELYVLRRAGDLAEFEKAHIAQVVFGEEL